jgi:hypothetical protein
MYLQKVNKKNNFEQKTKKQDPDLQVSGIDPRSESVTKCHGSTN